MLDVKELARECDRLEEFYRERKLPGEPGIQLFLYRSCRQANTARVLPGRPALRGQVVFWGSCDHPSVVIVKVGAVRAWLKGLFEHVPDGLEEALGKCAMRLVADKLAPSLVRVLRHACRGAGERQTTEQDGQDGTG